MGFRQGSISAVVTAASSALTLAPTSEAGVQFLLRSFAATMSASSATAAEIVVYDGTSSGTVIWRGHAMYPGLSHTFRDPGRAITPGNIFTFTMPAASSTGLTHTLAAEYVRRRTTASSS